MLQWNIRIATFFIVSAAIATTAVAQPQKHQGGGAPAARPAPAPHAAPAPAAPAPHAAAPAPRAPAPHIAAPRAAPQIAAPRHAPPQASAQRAAPQTPRVAPQQSARPSGGPPASAMARHAPTPRTSAAPAQQQPQITGRNAGGRGGERLAQPTQPSPRGNLARQAPAAGPAAAAGAGAAAAGAAAAAQSVRIGHDRATQQNVAPQAQLSRNPQTAASPRAFSGGVLRNQSFANLAAARDPSARILARSTFQGRFFNPQWRRHFARPIVIGWIGPLFWPYAYSDFIDYTFYSYAYDTFWPYAYDDFYDGMFGAYALGYGAAPTPRSDGQAMAAVPMVAAGALPTPLEASKPTSAAGKLPA